MWYAIYEVHVSDPPEAPRRYVGKCWSDDPYLGRRKGELNKGKWPRVYATPEVHVLATYGYSEVWPCRFSRDRDARKVMDSLFTVKLEGWPHRNVCIRYDKNGQPHQGEPAAYGGAYLWG